MSSAQSFVDSEIASQPECWARAADLAADLAAGLATGMATDAGTGVSRALPARGERIAVVGCGTSWFIAQSYAALRESSGAGESDAFAASEFPVGRTYDRVVAITRSGTTTEVCRLLAQLSGTATTVLTADANTPAAQAAAARIVLEFADEQSVVQTRFATSALSLLRASLGADVSASISDARRAVQAALPDGARGGEQFTFLGTGWTCGLALEAALKMREAAGVWSEAYPAMEYRHGPISIAGPNRLVWVFGALPSGLREEIERTGGQVVTSDLDPLADLVRAQRLAVGLAHDRGLDPDHPRHLTRSVVLPARIA